MRFRVLAKATALAAALLLLAPTGAQADQVTYDGDVNVSGTDIVVPGPCSLPTAERAGRISVKRTGNVHWNAGSALTISYSSPSPQVVVTGPSTVTVPAGFAQQGQSEFSIDISTKVVPGGTIAGLSGAADVTVGLSGPSTDSRTNITTTYTETGRYHVKWDCGAPVNAPPTVTVVGVTDGASYEYGNVPVAQCAVSDEDGTKSFAAALSQVVGDRAADGLGHQTATCAYTDQGGLTSSATATYGVVDTTGPAMPGLSDVSAEATSAAGAAVTYVVPDATDAVDGATVPACVPASGSTFPLGATTVSCTATDLSGNVSTGDFQVVVADTTAPVLNLPDSRTLDATSPAGASYTFSASTADAVSGDVPVTCDPTSGATFGFGVTTVSCFATDGAGNRADGSFVVTVQDRTAPVVTVPGDVMLEATGPAGATHSFVASAVDDVDGPVDVSCDPGSGNAFALGTTSVTCTATDNHGNTGNGGFVITVQDTTAPQLSLPGDVTIEATSSTGAPATFAANASDIVDADVFVTCSASSGDQFALGTTTVTCWANDDSGNMATGSFTVRVVDTTPPTMPAYTDLVDVEATSAAGAVVQFDAGTATDLVDGRLAVTCAPSSGSTFGLGTTTVVCTATDAAGNTGRNSFSVTVVDTTAPELDLPANSTVEATGALTPVSYGPVTASDAVDAAPDVTCDPATGTSHGLGTVTVTCTATDDAGNNSSGSFTVTMQDTTAPAIEDLENLTVEATSAAGARVTYGTVRATDAVDGELKAVCTPASDGVFPLGDTTVDCLVTDSSGNKGTSSFTVVVRDTTAPRVTAPDAQQLTATSAVGAAVTFSVSALDAVDGDVPVTCITPDGSSVVSGAVLPLGTTTVTCSASDRAGNTGTATFTVTVTVGWGGFGQPINPGGPAAFKLNSTIPVKFSLTGASAGIAQLDARLYVRRLDTATPAAVETVAVATGSANAGNAFRFDADAGQYVFNLATKPLGSGRFELRADLGDGTTHTIEVVIRK